MILPKQAGRPVTDVGWGGCEPSEAALVHAVRVALAASGAPTLARTWNPGDRAVFRGRELEILAHYTMSRAAVPI
jgi:hypothetical protein